jgi:pyridoxal phosphate enzyme (YggS family)
VRARVEAATVAAQRHHEVQVVAVSKSFPIEAVAEAFAAGQSIFGENRVQEALPKIEKLHEAAWHLVGHLQTNKVKPATAAFSLIESVDSVRLAAKLDIEAARQGRRVAILLEVNVAEVGSKYGFSAAECVEAIPGLRGLAHLKLRGLMTVAPLSRDPESVRWVFRSLRELRDRIAVRYELPEFDQLSMGMSNDFEVAVQEGATMVRIGRAIFGERPTGGAG